MPTAFCPSFHVVTKKKDGLKWYQVSQIHAGQVCDACGRDLGPGDIRWRCWHHCDYDICNDCAVATGNADRCKVPPCARPKGHSAPCLDTYGNVLSFQMPAAPAPGGPPAPAASAPAAPSAPPSGTAKFCTKCGHAAQGRFCTNCGNSLNYGKGGGKGNGAAGRNVGNNLQEAICPKCTKMSRFQLDVGIHVVECTHCRLKFKMEVKKVDMEEEDTGQAIDDDVIGAIPSYWTYSKATQHFDQMLPVSKHKHGSFEGVINDTIRERATRDRPCPKPDPSKCPPTPGGCNCVKPGGNPGLPTMYSVRRVIRVEDSELWSKYVAKRTEISRLREHDDAKVLLDPAPQTAKYVNDNEHEFEPLQTDINEVYLWHGTATRTALAIAQNDFRIDLAGTGAGTMYGCGAYLGENSTKADEYAKDEPGGYYEGIFAMLLCRVTMGKFLYVTNRDTDAGKKVGTGEWDSTVGDRLASADTFREFVVYDSAQIYPEYIVLYSRIHQRDSPQLVASLTRPFYMELPVYWSNCHVDPRTPSAFHMQYRVNKSTHDVLLKFLSGCLAGTGTHAELLDARRIEQSDAWMKYVEFKRQMRQRGDLPPVAGEVETLRIMDTILSTQDCEGSISVENLEERINEFMLWHGTNKHIAEVIARSNFKIAGQDDKFGNQVKWGQRFGAGAYFAEHLPKSLSYAKADDDGTQYLLLSRVCCGSIHKTTSFNDTGADQVAKARGHTCTLADPNNQGPREFIVFSEAQVYPEYLLKVKVVDGEGPEITPSTSTKSGFGSAPPTFSFSGGMCVKGCGRKRFRNFPTCCRQCDGLDTSHAPDCGTKS